MNQWAKLYVPCYYTVIDKEYRYQQQHCYLAFFQICHVWVDLPTSMTLHYSTVCGCQCNPLVHNQAVQPIHPEHATSRCFTHKQSAICVYNVLVCNSFECPAVSVAADKTACLHTDTHKLSPRIYKLCCEAWGTSITKTPVVQNPWSQLLVLTLRDKLPTTHRLKHRGISGHDIANGTNTDSH